MKIHEISPDHLTIEDIKKIIRKGYQIKLSDESVRRIQACRDYLDNKMKTHKEPIYGITTGFGSLCNISVGADELSQLQKNLVMSHACGTGDEVDSEIVKIIIFLKIQSLQYGVSGVQVVTVQRLVDMFNNDVLPAVYQLGSLGASGDLAPLSHMSLPLLGLGEVWHDGKKQPAGDVNKKFGWEPITLKSKEGLALLNGTQFMAAHAVWALIKADEISRAADTIGAVSLEGFDGRIEPFTHEVHAVRPHNGQIATAARMRELLKGSEIVKQYKAHVQDPYSFRCIPQVHGASKDAIAYVSSVVETEINSATDNPTVIPEKDMVISAGNFHGQPLAITMDFLSIALAELGSISGQRINQLISGKRGLPSFLVAKPGLNSGFMIPQYAAASIVSQSKQLCMPASVDSIESSQGQEDHVSMGANAATKLCRVALNTERILGIELFNAVQALEFRRPLKSSTEIERLVAEYRKEVSFVDIDRVMYPSIEKSIRFIRRYF
jgi:histidine ammonia-lyase